MPLSQFRVCSSANHESSIFSNASKGQRFPKLQKKRTEKKRLSCGRSTFQFWTSNERFQLARLPPKEGRKPPFPLCIEASFLYSKASFSRPSFHKHALQGQRTSWKAYFAGLQGQPVRLLPFRKLTQPVLWIFFLSLFTRINWLNWQRICIALELCSILILFWPCHPFLL